MRTTETHCHCGRNFNGSDHCPCCGCEQFERTCEWVCQAPEVDFFEHEDGRCGG